MAILDIRIKNMVCPRCITAVKGVLEAQEIEFSEVNLGTVKMTQSLSENQKHALSISLLNLGFELLESDKSALISQIKTLIIQQIHHSSESLQVNFSTYLSKQLQQEYTSLSKLFSSVEGLTIEKFITTQKIEKAKELILYDQMNLAEIAFQIGYSNSAYLSAQFKKETGMTPTEFRKQSDPNRKSLDSI